MARGNLPQSGFPRMRFLTRIIVGFNMDEIIRASVCWKAENRSSVAGMRWISIGLFVLHSATLIYVLQQDSGITLGVQVGNAIYSAEFPRRELKQENLTEGSQIQAEVKDGKLTVQRNDPKTAAAPIIWVQRTLAHVSAQQKKMPSGAGTNGKGTDAALY
jgi:antitoxin component of MazEF toxin-antitoxin module